MTLWLITFVGQAEPGVPPLDIQPPRNVITARLNTNVSVTYDEPISAATVTSRTFAVHGMQSGLVTAAHGVVNGNTIIVTPTNLFHQGELVYAIATTQTLNITGTGPVSGTQWQFNAGVVSNRCVSGFVTATAASANLVGVSTGSVAWGDYDGDGDLDILLTGGTDGSDGIAYVYEYTNTTFVTDTAASQNLFDVYRSSVAWGDYDNDGDLDILLTGTPDGSNRIAYVYEYTNTTFVADTAASVNLVGVSDGSVAWGDYDNDGDLDILLTGWDSSLGYNYNALIYENQAGIFITDTVASANLTGVAFSSVAWGDYDNDGDLDILLTGTSDGFDGIAYVYENTGSGFVTDTAASANLTAVHGGSVAWGDYDNDGDLDILLTGEDSSGVCHTLVYENRAGVFVTDTLASANLIAVSASSVAWGDYDNDGDLDILLTGRDSSGGNALVYENQASVFIADTIASANLVGVYYSSVAWGDYDGDGDLDILLTGYDGSGRNALIYRNDGYFPPEMMYYLPLVTKNYVAPDLVVDSVVATRDAITTSNQSTRPGR